MKGKQMAMEAKSVRSLYLSESRMRRILAMMSTAPPGIPRSSEILDPKPNPLITEKERHEVRSRIRQRVCAVHSPRFPNDVTPP